jgi:anti-anti-sigma factor
MREEGTLIATHAGEDGILVCKPSGVLDWSTSVAFRHVVDYALLVGSDVVIDLTRVPRIDASGLTAIFRCMRRARSTEGTVQVINPQPQVRRWIKMLAVTGVTKAPAWADGHDAA